MKEQLQKFLDQYLGKPNVGNTPENTGQCVGLVVVFLRYLGLPHIWGHAKDLLANADPKYYEVIRNSPDNFPQPGDIVVWGTKWGEYGHTAIVRSANVNEMETTDQNFRDHKYVENVRHTYFGVEGWLRPRITVANQELVDKLRKERDTNWNLYQSALKERDQLLAKNADLEKKLSENPLKGVLLHIKDDIKNAGL